MYRHLSLNDKFVFVNLEDAIQIENEEFKIMFVWCKWMMQMYLLHQLKQTFGGSLPNITISSHLIGLYNASNLYAAITIGKYFEVDENSIRGFRELYSRK
jgi:UDP-N-acetylmuramoyl-tripeptide--D-alanyl-D-alanine ligase